MSFQTIITNTLDGLKSLDCVPLILPKQFAYIERAEIEGQLIMQTHFVQIANKGQLRFVHITAPKIEVLTLFFFPNYEWQLPVYCLELVIFNKQPIIGLLDIVCVTDMACCDTIQQLMQKAHEDNSQLLQASDMPDWFLQCRSGLDFFIRPSDMNELTQLSELHYQLLAEFKHLLQTACLFNESESLNYKQHLQNYKQHHRIHAPGLRLMNRSFGETWTNDYMQYFFQ